MGRKPVPQPLTLADSTRLSDEPPARVGETAPSTATHTIISTTTPTPSDTRSPRSPLSPFRFGQKKAESAGGPHPLQPPTDVLRHQKQQQQQRHPQREDPRCDDPSSNLCSPSLPKGQPDQRAPSPAKLQYGYGHGQKYHSRDEDKTSKSGFFSHFKSSKSSDRLNASQYPDSRAETMSRDSDRPSLSQQQSKHSDSSYQDNLEQIVLPTLPSKSDLSLASSTEYDPTSNSKKNKPKPFTLLNRTRSIKDKENKDSPSPKEFGPAQVRLSEPDRSYPAAPLRTAPFQSQDRSFREMMSSAARNHSAERSQAREFSGSKGRDFDAQSSKTHASSLRENSGSAFLSGLRNSKAAGILSKGFFGGGGSRNDTMAHKEPVIDDEHYVLKVINLPLVEQTRKTRISKRLEDSRDKTEFWMPAFPWRAIDYLNYKGSDVEGLYRVPGSGQQIKKWQRKFDEELDVDLFEQDDLYDINIIGSMLKAWLRELPDELFPKAAQDRIARECAGAEKVPELLIEELSNLSPFNYYLLFAITCHLSLLLAHSDKNKMDFRNLCICFQPCMKIDAFCFKFLVCDWRECWRGCKNEAKYIEEEYALFDQPPPRGIGNSNTELRSRDDKTPERNISSSDSSKHSNRSGKEQKGRLRKKSAPENGSVETSSTISTTLTINSEREAQTPPPRGSGELRPLSPIKPLSPLGF